MTNEFRPINRSFSAAILTVALCEANCFAAPAMIQAELDYANLLLTNLLYSTIICGRKSVKFPSLLCLVRGSFPAFDSQISPFQLPT